jgi:hypothetical protein
MGGHQFHNKEEVQMAVHKWLCMQESVSYCDRMFKIMQKWNKCISMFGDYVGK